MLVYPDRGRNVPWEEDRWCCRDADREVSEMAFVSLASFSCACLSTLISQLHIATFSASC